MNNDGQEERSNWCFKFPWSKSAEKPIVTLTAFTRDAEHELMAVLTALQAQIDLFHKEQTTSNFPTDRFATLNKTVSRLISDTYLLSAIAILATEPRTSTNNVLELLINEIVVETEAEFSKAGVSISCTIEKGVTIKCDAPLLKQMCKETLILMLEKCQDLDTVKIVGLTEGKSVTISYDTGSGVNAIDYVPWRVGHLQQIPTNGDGIKLSSIDAMARLNRGQLDYFRKADLRDAYKLVFWS